MLSSPRARKAEDTAANGAFSMKRLGLFAFTSLALVLAGCGGTSTARLGSDDVAVVGSKAITKDQFQSLMARAKKSYDTQKRPFPKPGTAEYEQLKGQAVSYLAQQAEVAQEAEDKGIKITEDKVKQRIEH